jgi:hypothetical protein
MEMYVAGIAFAVLFCIWVILPGILKKRHAAKNEAIAEE